MDGIGGIGHQHRVARTHGSQGQVRQAFLGADGDDGLGLGIQVHVETALVPATDGAAQARDAARHRVAVGVATLGRLDQFIDDVLGGRPVGIAHAEIDDVLPARAGLGLQLIDDVEHIGGEALDSGEFVVQFGTRGCGYRRLNKDIESNKPHY